MDATPKTPTPLPPRHLPPTAVPLTPHELAAGLRTDDAALDRFRAALAAYLGVAQTFLAASGRTALYTLLRGLHRYRPERPQIVMPAYTCPAVAKVAQDVGLQPRFVDLQPETMTYAPEALAAALGAQTLAVIVVHPFGIPQDVAAVGRAAHAVGAVVLEDAAQALGARWHGRAVGTQGDFGLYSLGPGKPLSTGGGGVAVARAPEDAARLARWWRDLPPATALTAGQAWLRQAALQLAFHPLGWWAATRLGLHRLGNHEASWGYTVRGLTASQAGVGLATLPRLDALNAQRRANAEAVLRRFASDAVRPLAVAEAAEPIYLRLPLLTRDEATREQLFARLWAAGIGVGRMYERTLPALFPQAGNGRFPGAERIARCLLTLPTHSYVTRSDVAHICAILRAA